MLNRLTTALLLTCAAASASADISGDWKLYNSFDNDVGMVIDSPDRTYMLALGQAYVPSVKTYSVPSNFLFVYEKEADELLSYNSRNYLSDDIIATAAYNPQKDYLIVVYQNGNIDLLHADGTVRNIPGLKAANLTSSKTVNAISFSPENDEVYLATDFGYLVVDDKLGEISESHVYHQRTTAAARVGDFVLLATDEGIFSAPAADNKLSFSSFKKASADKNASAILPLEGNTFLARTPLTTSIYRLMKGTMTADGTATLSSVRGSDKASSCITYSNNGYLCPTASALLHVATNGEVTSVDIAPEDAGLAVSSADFKEFWFGAPRKGLSSKKRSDSAWSVTRDYMLPNSPAVMLSGAMTWSDKYGMLVSNHGINRLFPAYQYSEHILLSALQDGMWERYAPAYTNPEFTKVLVNPRGCAIDPNNPDHVYLGSHGSGLAKIDLSDDYPTSILHMGQPYSSEGLPGFVELVPTYESWKGYCNFGTPAFDNEGNLWTMYDHTSANLEYGHIWVWPAEDVKNENVSGWQHFDIKDFNSSYGLFPLPLKAANNKNLVVLVGHVWDDTFAVLDHKNTLRNTTDDRSVIFEKIYDQDGNEVTKNYINYMWEDPNSGMVWACTSNGVFTFNPSQAFANPGRVSRIKVSRNDGTNLADYLLDNINVTQMTVDAAGRKWFGTVGGGVVVTSSDGKEILAQFTADNSYLPQNNVYALGFNPQSGSMLIATGSGLAEFFPSGSSTNADMDSARAYPNPVRPDYLGWVTIDGLTDNVLVKIVDASGSLVKELGLCSGGSAKWDVTNMNGNRVRTGVYYVCASSGPGDQNISKVTKILVVN